MGKEKTVTCPSTTELRENHHRLQGTIRSRKKVARPGGQERNFANMEVRAGKSYYGEQENYDKVLRLGAIHRKIRRVLFLLGMRRFFVLLGKLLPEEVALLQFMEQTICGKTGLVHPI